MNPPHDTATVAPFWRVQSVFDPDGTGKDFAYTIGLHERGLPELHIWARPSLGEDPGLDWMFSNRDRTGVLNELAGLLVAGRLSIGSEVTREYDEGLAQVTFRVEPPGDKEALEAYGVPPGVDVLPVLWSLRRAPEGPLAPLTPEAEEQAHTLFLEISRGLDFTREAPPGWELPSMPWFDVGQRFGPLTPVVLARAAQLWQADDNTLRDLLHSAVATSAGFSLSAATVMATATARPAGRRVHVEVLHDACHDLVDHLTEHSEAARHRFSRIIQMLHPQQWSSLDRANRSDLRLNLGGLLHYLTVGCLAVEAVADLADQPLLLQARGPWVAGLRGEHVLSDPAWRAAPQVIKAVHWLLAPCDAQTLSKVADVHYLAVVRGIVGAEGYGDVCARLQSWALTSAANCSWNDVLCALPGGQPLLWTARGADIGSAPLLESWATCVASALTHRARLSTEDVHTFAVPFAADLPHLEGVLNAAL
ncbi:MAG TPA: hypothetical protein VFJ14_05705 [Nocardioidaceae bacterium]|nr:hypothetical protein [Nocardioidaceae bacterium]